MSNKVRTSYDAVAERYADAFANELTAKPLDRALLDTLVELCGDLDGPIVDVGCGPGHVTRYLADRRRAVRGVDLSPAMIAIARARYPGIDFRVQSMLALDDANETWAGVVALYSIIHLSAAERALACRSFARALRSGGSLLLAFHVSTAEHPPGAAIHLDRWFDTPVDLVGHFLEPESVITDLDAAGFEVRARLDRDPWSDNEFPSRRCYLVAKRP